MTSDAGAVARAAAPCALGRRLQAARRGRPEREDHAQQPALLRHAGVSKTPVTWQQAGATARYRNTYQGAWRLRLASARMLDMLTQHWRGVHDCAAGPHASPGRSDMLSSTPCRLQRAGELGMEGLSARLRGRLAAYVAHVLECSYEVPGALEQPASHSLSALTAPPSQPPFQHPNQQPVGACISTRHAIAGACISVRPCAHDAATAAAPGRRARLRQQAHRAAGRQVLMGVLRKELEPGLHISRRSQDDFHLFLRVARFFTCFVRLREAGRAAPCHVHTRVGCRLLRTGGALLYLHRGSVAAGRRDVLEHHRSSDQVGAALPKSELFFIVRSCSPPWAGVVIGLDECAHAGATGAPAQAETGAQGSRRRGRAGARGRAGGRLALRGHLRHHGLGDVLPGADALAGRVRPAPARPREGLAPAGARPCRLGAVGLRSARAGPPPGVATRRQRLCDCTGHARECRLLEKSRTQPMPMHGLRPHSASHARFSRSFKQGRGAACEPGAAQGDAGHAGRRAAHRHARRPEGRRPPAAQARIIHGPERMPLRASAQCCMHVVWRPSRACAQFAWCRGWLSAGQLVSLPSCWSAACPSVPGQGATACPAAAPGCCTTTRRRAASCRCWRA